MYNDCWAAANGWAIVDYYVKPKPGYYAFKRAAQPVIASIEKKDNKLNVYCCNDSLEKISGKAKLYLYDFKADKNVWETDFDFGTEENSTSKVYTIAYNDVEKLMTKTTMLICDAETNLGNDRAFFVAKRFCDLDIEYSDVEIIDRNDDEITVKAKTFTPFVMLDEEMLLEDNCFMLKAGETRTVRFVK